MVSEERRHLELHDHTSIIWGIFTSQVVSTCYCNPGIVVDNIFVKCMRFI